MIDHCPICNKELLYFPQDFEWYEQLRCADCPRDLESDDDHFVWIIDTNRIYIFVNNRNCYYSLRFTNPAVCIYAPIDGRDKIFDITFESIEKFIEFCKNYLNHEQENSMFQ